MSVLSTGLSAARSVASMAVSTATGGFSPWVILIAGAVFISSIGASFGLGAWWESERYGDKLIAESSKRANEAVAAYANKVHTMYVAAVADAKERSAREAQDQIESERALLVAEKGVSDDEKCGLPSASVGALDAIRLRQQTGAPANNSGRMSAIGRLVGPRKGATPAPR